MNKYYDNLYDAVTDNGRLEAIHFETWANKIEEEQGYTGSELPCLLRRIATYINNYILENDNDN